MDLYLQTEFDRFCVVEGLFVIEKKKRQHTFNPQQVSRIWLNHKTQVEGEVIQLALKNRIDIVFLSSEGFPVGTISPYHRRQGIYLQEKQWKLATQPDAATMVAIYLFKGQRRRLELVETTFASPPMKELVILQKIVQQNQRYFCKEELPFPSELQEAYFAKAYYKVLNQLLPVAYQFSKRSRQPAQDAFNATLNYALGWLYSMVHNAVRKAKLDPYTGFHHRPKDGEPALVFDLIEAYRAWTEEACIILFRNQKLQESDFIPSSKNTSGLVIEKEARRRIIQQVHQTFQQTTGGENRLSNIYEDAREFARFIKNYDFL